jgi:hypothetical protein
MQRRLSILLFPIKLTIHGPVWMFLPEETTMPHNTYFFDCLSHILQLSSKECGQVAPFLLLKPERLQLFSFLQVACI